MRKALVLFLLCTACRTDPSSESELPPETQPEEWWTYEGVVRSDAGNDIIIELSLLQGAVGLPSSYRAREEFVSFEDRLFLSSNGQYTILLGPSDVGNIVEIKDKKAVVHGTDGPGLRGGKNERSKKLFEMFKTKELFFKTGELGDLIQVDRNHNRVAPDDRYTLKRRSKLYTVEGFITFDADTTEFYEINTHQTWSVSRAGAYGEANVKYIALAKERHEGIYMKGVGFFVRARDRDGNEIESMVIKRIISMKSHEQLVGQ